MITPGIDHIALTVPDLDEQVARLTSAFGMVVEARFDGFALLTDPVSGLKLELGRSDDSQVHFRHFGFRADDVDGAHESLVNAGMKTSEAPHRRDFARMYTSFLTQPGGLEIQLVRYDDNGAASRLRSRHIGSAGWARSDGVVAQSGVYGDWCQRPWRHHVTSDRLTTSAPRWPSNRTLAVASALVAGTCLLALIAEDLLDGGGLLSRDEAVLTWFVDHRTDRWINVAELVSRIGAFVSLTIIGALLAIWLWRRGWHVCWRRLHWCRSGWLASHQPWSSRSSIRDRPPVSLHATAVTVAAFPSGHVTHAAAFGLAASFTLALTIAHRPRTQAVLVVAGLFFAALVGLSRLVLCVHWLSDVVAGWALGSAAAIAVVVTVWYLTTCDQENAETRGALH